MNKKCMQRRQPGAVSLFVVIFAALLMSIVTVSFIQLMLKDQQQATANDLSQSAYDSAQAGVEDAKRLLLAAQSCTPSSAQCQQMQAAVASGKCSTIADSGLVSQQNQETMIQETNDPNGTSAALDQAYTCVKITPNTPDYENKLAANESNLIPLRSASGTPFDTVTISWFSAADLSNGATTVTPRPVGNQQLPPQASWNATTPPILRAQLIQTGSSFSLSDFDNANSNTLFLYPTNLMSFGNPTLLNFASDVRRNNLNTGPEVVACTPALGVATQYACVARITLPAPQDGDTTNRGAYLRLSSLYNGTHYTVTLNNSKSAYSVVLFNNVQPIVDSTGRANTLFRRVSARVELTGSMPYPEAAVDLAGGLCKNFIVTNNPNDYQDFATNCVAPSGS